jgi:hypothetical protein
MRFAARHDGFRRSGRTTDKRHVSAGVQSLAFGGGGLFVCPTKRRAQRIPLRRARLSSAVGFGTMLPNGQGEIPNATARLQRTMCIMSRGIRRCLCESWPDFSALCSRSGQHHAARIASVAVETLATCTLTFCELCHSAVTGYLAEFGCGRSGLKDDPPHRSGHRTAHHSWRRVVGLRLREKGALRSPSGRARLLLAAPEWDINRHTPIRITGL